MRGFTLVELILMIIIVGILASVALPRYIDLQDSAYSAQRDGNASAVRAAVSLYYAQTAVNGQPSFPAAIIAALFADSQVPSTSSDTWTWSYAAATGIVSTN